VRTAIQNLKAGLGRADYVSVLDRGLVTMCSSVGSAAYAWETVTLSLHRKVHPLEVGDKGMNGVMTGITRG